MNEPQEVPVIDLSKFNKNKKWIIFYKLGCNSCHDAIKYFEANGIKFEKYDIMTKEGLAKAAEYQIIEECKKWIPIIIENK
jgi:arsenate reductase-like glutaredoxin family protein